MRFVADVEGKRFVLRVVESPRAGIVRGDVFTPAHINHSSTRWNVVAGGVGRQVSFYVCRDISAGEELLLDYGRKYWRARKGEEMP
jgi:hypothetical protein